MSELYRVKLLDLGLQNTACRQHFRDEMTSYQQSRLWSLTSGAHISSKGPQDGIGIREYYAAPEVLFPTPITPKPGLPSDIWSFACTIFGIRVDGVHLFTTRHGLYFIVRTMELFQGLFPEPYRSALDDVLRTGRRRWHGHEDESGKQTAKVDTPSNIGSNLQMELRAMTPEEFEKRRKEEVDGSGYPDIFEAILGRNLQARANTNSNKPSSNEQSGYSKYRDHRREALDLADLLRKMLRYDPAERISIGEISRHLWIEGS
ncbi:hypothetical protein F5X99DRAFT_408753 [Biscogniauxia marginata]|nr:hypothetical protein F5X99DRAFT_408753 [Biscogniauxia marginata]